MTALLTSLPGDIPGLLRRWSVIVVYDINGITGEPRARRGVICPDGRVCLDDGSLFRINDHIDRIALDLTDKTGRWHVALWVDERQTAEERPTSKNEWDAHLLALFGADMTPAEIDTLARLVLRLAGRTP